MRRCASNAVASIKIISQISYVCAAGTPRHSHIVLHSRIIKANLRLLSSIEVYKIYIAVAGEAAQPKPARMRCGTRMHSGMHAAHTGGCAHSFMKCDSYVMYLIRHSHSQESPPRSRAFDLNL